MTNLLTPQKLAPPGRRLRRERQAAESAARTRQVADQLAEASGRPAAQLLQELETTPAGLSYGLAQHRLERDGANVLTPTSAPRWYTQLAKAFWNPFILVLAVLVTVMYAQWLQVAGEEPFDPKIAILGAMVLISVGLRFWQEYRSNSSAAALQALVTTTTAVQRLAGNGRLPTTVEIPMDGVVKGDLIKLAAGDLVPADLRLLTAKDLMISQAALSGESLPAAKADTRFPDDGQRLTRDPVEADNLALAGTSVTSGTATGVVVATGADTYFGSMADVLTGERPETGFDTGVKKVSMLLIRFMLVMVPIVFLINGVTKGDWAEAFTFAVAVAVGLTPEMLPMVVTTNLARGAVALSRRKVVVKRLNAIQNLGAMDVLCTDKTGTLTEDRIVLDSYLDIHGEPDDEVLEYAYLNSHFQTGLRNLLDQAVIDRMHEAEEVVVDARFTLVDEIPFDFARRRMSVVLRRNDADGPAGEHILITKGAVEEVLDRCSHLAGGGRRAELTDTLRRQVLHTAAYHQRQGMRVLAVATRTLPGEADGGRGDARATYGVEDETGLTLIGFLAFLDPPKQDAARALAALADSGIAVKVITGDNELVAARVCADVGLDVGTVVTGAELDGLDEAQLRALTRTTTVFAKADPTQKARIVRALQADGHTVGFLGDGINDAAALRDADVGISVDTAVDIAKESADIILLEKDLMVLEQGVLRGRLTFGNTIKYLKMTASSNFGNVFSVLAASAFLPFQPMLAMQLLVQNLLYDISQLATPWDRMDREYVRTPRTWDARGIGRFMLVLGPTSSVFDITTFLLMWHVFGANSEVHQALFQSGWFVEGLLTQTLVVHMLRTRRIPFVQSRATLPVMVMTAAVTAIGLYLPFSPLAGVLGMQALPMAYFPWLVATLGAYCLLTQGVKTWYIRRFGSWL